MVEVEVEPMDDDPDEALRAPHRRAALVTDPTARELDEHILTGHAVFS